MRIVPRQPSNVDGGPARRGRDFEVLRQQGLFSRARNGTSQSRDWVVAAHPSGDTKISRRASSKLSEVSGQEIGRTRLAQIAGHAGTESATPNRHRSDGGRLDRSGQGRHRPHRRARRSRAGVRHETGFWLRGLPALCRSQGDRGGRSQGPDRSRSAVGQICRRLARQPTGASTPASLSIRIERLSDLLHQRARSGAAQPASVQFPAP